MTALVRYEAARAALQAAHDVDEVKDIRDKAQAMAAYAQQAKDTKLVEWASEIKVRAERKAGAMLAELKINGSGHKNLKKGAKNSPESSGSTPGPTLDSIGISKFQSAAWQKVAAIPEEKFEKAVAATKESAGVVTTAAVLRTAAAKPRKETPPPAPKGKEPADDKALAKLNTELIELQGKYADLLEKHADLGDTARDLSDKLEMFKATEPDEQQKIIASLQKKVKRLEQEVDRVTVARNDCSAKNNELIREVKRLKKKAGEK